MKRNIDRIEQKFNEVFGLKDGAIFGEKTDEVAMVVSMTIIKRAVVNDIEGPVLRPRGVLNQFEELELPKMKLAEMRKQVLKHGYLESEQQEYLADLITQKLIEEYAHDET